MHFQEFTIAFLVLTLHRSSYGQGNYRTSSLSFFRQSETKNSRVVLFNFSLLTCTPNTTLGKGESLGEDYRVKLANESVCMVRVGVYRNRFESLYGPLVVSVQLDVLCIDLNSVGYCASWDTLK